MQTAEKQVTDMPVAGVNIAEMGIDPAIISQKADVVSGVPVFTGTRVPVRLLLDYLAGGEPLEVFLRNYPSVGKEEAKTVLELAFERTIGPRDHENPLR